MISSISSISSNIDCLVSIFASCGGKGRGRERGKKKRRRERGKWGRRRRRWMNRLYIYILYIIALLQFGELGDIYIYILVNAAALGEQSPIYTRSNFIEPCLYVDVIDGVKPYTH